MRRNDLPAAFNFHPYIRQTIMILVALAPRVSFLVIRTRYYGCVPVHAHLKARQLSGLYFYRSVSAVADVPFFSVGRAVLDRNDEVLCEQRRQDANVTVLVRLRPLLFEGENLFGILRFLLCTQRSGQNAQQQDKDRKGVVEHGPFLHSLPIPPSLARVTSSVPTHVTPLDSY